MKVFSAEAHPSAPRAALVLTKTIMAMKPNKQSASFGCLCLFPGRKPEDILCANCKGKVAAAKLEDITAQILEMTHRAFDIGDLHAIVLSAFHLGQEEKQEFIGVSGWLEEGRKKGYLDYYKKRLLAKSRGEENLRRLIKQL